MNPTVVDLKPGKYLSKEPYPDFASALITGLVIEEFRNINAFATLSPFPGSLPLSDRIRIFRARD
jgi:hypothetical protein